jgi:photosystem II stability/assembly factor-like uncharacterized protein
VWNDETYYDLGGPEGEQYILISDLGKIWHGYLQDGCLQDLFEDTQNQTNNLLYRIEYFEEFYLMIVVGENGTILREDNPSVVNDWDLINSPTNNNLKGLCKSGNSIFAAGDAGTVIKSDDEGVTWELLTFPYNVNLNDCSSPAAGEVICVGPSFTAYRTTDYGATWGQIFFGDVFLASIKSEQGGGFQRVYYFDNKISYIIGSGVVFRTNNNWNTFEFQDPGTSEQLNDVFFVSPDTGVIIGNNGTARFTSDGGQNWFEDPDVTTALDGTTLKHIKKQADDFGLIVGEGGLSIAFARDSTAFTAVKDEPQVVTEYSLSQNYPNPFNPTTKIKFEIPSTSLVTLKIYDLLGNEIATLVDEEKTAGVYEAEFKAEELTSGIYFYRITVGNYSETKKLLLLK